MAQADQHKRQQDHVCINEARRRAIRFGGGPLHAQDARDQNREAGAAVAH